MGGKSKPETKTAWREKNREKIRAYFREYKRKNRTRMLKLEAERRLTIKLEIIAKYGGKCRKCGFDDPRALCIDHVNGSGEKDRVKATGDKIYRRLRRLPCSKQYQLLCANCNLIKAFVKREFHGGSIRRWDKRYRRHDVASSR